MALAIAYVYEHTLEERDLKTDILLIMAGDAALSSIKDMGLEFTQGRLTRKAIQAYLSEEALKKLVATLPKIIIGRTTRKASQRIMRLVPIASAPVGFAFDYAAAKAIGRAAIAYYWSGRLKHLIIQKRFYCRRFRFCFWLPARLAKHVAQCIRQQICILYISSDIRPLMECNDNRIIRELIFWLTHKPPAHLLAQMCQTFCPK